MKTVPIAGTGQSVTFFEDDTVETVRQWIALAVNSHPDRMFLQVKGNFPKDLYSSNPLRWTDLFHRLSVDGKVISADALATYVTQIRPETGVVARSITLDEWESRGDDLKPLYDPEVDFDEWRVLGVPESQSVVLPLPPKDVVLPPARIPVPKTQSLFETFHAYDITEFKVIFYDPTMSETVRRTYFPLVTPETPNNIETLRNSLETAQQQLKKLLDLDVPRHERVSVVRARWRIPLVSTRFTAPRSRFEQIFYGMTMTEDTPYIGYFTAKTETMRHKMYTEDATSKKPFLDVGILKGWLSNTQPQRRTPTLLLYRSPVKELVRNVFDRVAVTSKDIVVTAFRNKDSTETLDELKASVETWMKTLDALVPFLDMQDIALSRWELDDLSLVASYDKEIREFDMHRFPCLQTLFGFQNDQFRLLRAEHEGADVSPRELQVAQLFAQADTVVTPELIAEELRIPQDEADALFAAYQERAADYDIEKTLRAYPVLKFSNKEVIVKFVTSLERTLQYADILRFVLTSDSDQVNDVCPRRMESVAPTGVTIQQEVGTDEDLAPDEELAALLGDIDEDDIVPEAAVSAAPRERKFRIGKTTTRTYNYFNTRLQSYDPNTFDKDIYPSKCEKKKQVVVLTPDDQARLGPTYNYEKAPASEKLSLEDPAGVAICPPYWCIRDELPLRQEQLVAGDDGELHCPVCNGKIRTTDTLDVKEYPVIKRDTASKYPDYMNLVSSINQRRMPCCYQVERRKESIALGEKKEDETYILKPDTPVVPSKRLAYLSPLLAARIHATVRYETNIKNDRLPTGKGDIFRVGLGRPSETLPVFLKDDTPIRTPKEARENTMQCSFFRTWTPTQPGDTEIDRIINSIDYAYIHNQLSILQEVEYVTSFLRCNVILVDMTSMEVICGFWKDVLGADSRTIALLGEDILCHVERKKTGKTFTTQYNADLRKKPFADSVLPVLRGLHAQACSIDAPTLEEAIAELKVPDYDVILDPFQRIQAVFVPGEIILPIQPTEQKPDPGVGVRSGYGDIKNELPTGSKVRDFLSGTKHPKFKLTATPNLHDVNGKVVELYLTSGFRIPIQPEDDGRPEVAREVVSTLLRHSETQLVEGKPNKADVALAEKISYQEEIYQFLLFSLSKDIEADADGNVLKEEEGALRNAIQTRSTDLLKQLKDWFAKHAHEDTTVSKVKFVNKVRTPCGQYTKEETCNKSSLCGWFKQGETEVCKIRVKPLVDKDVLLKRMAKTLRDNDKQRALVLDGRMSPFFSTILYLEMPNEVITNVL